MLGRNSFFNRIPKLATIVITFLLMIVSGLVMYLYTVTQNTLYMALTIVCTIMFVFSMNATIARFATFKMKPPKFPKAYYKLPTIATLESRLVRAGFTKTNRQFGIGFIKIEGKTAYKLLIVENADIYFAPDKQKESQKATKGIEKCNELVGFEIFYDITEEVLRRIPDFSFKGDRVLYEGFYADKEKDLLVEANKIEVDNHIDAYNRLMAILEFEKSDYVEPTKKEVKKMKKCSK